MLIEIKKYHENTNKLETIYYVNGIDRLENFHGFYKAYYENGDKRAVEFYDGGSVVGTWKHFNYTNHQLEEINTSIKIKDVHNQTHGVWVRFKY